MKTLKTPTKIIALFSIALTYSNSYGQDWNNPNPPNNASSPIFRPGKVAIGTSYEPDNSTLSWYGTQGPGLEVCNSNILGSGTGSSLFLSSLSGNNSGNMFRQNNWLLRQSQPYSAGWAWSNIALHDGLSIDGVYNTPGTDTKTWWERDPSNNVQRWGNDNQVYMRLKAGKFSLGMYADPDEASAWHLNPATPNSVNVARQAPAFEVWSKNGLGQNAGNAELISSFSAPTGPTGASSWFRQNSWIVRTNNNSMFKAKIHDGISVDNWYTEPGVNTLTWWERDPELGIQKWGALGNTYMTLDNGNLYIGAQKPDPSGVHSNARLSVDGKVIAKSFYVTVAQNVWADYVFSTDYKILELNEVERFVREKKHLPGFPSASEIEKSGVNLAETNIKLLEKLEEAYLYIIQMNKRLEVLERKNNK